MNAPARPLAGVLWMVVTGAMFVGVTACVKHLGDRVPAPEAAFLRYVLGLVFLVPMARPVLAALADRGRIRLFAGRGAFHALGVILWFYAMTQIPIAEVTALNYLSPVYVSLGAALFLCERISWPRITAIVVALLGVLLILRPGFRAISPGHVAMMGTAVLFAGSYLLAKVASAETAPSVVVAMLSIWTTLGLAPFALAVWVAPSANELAWLFLVAVLATTGHFTMTLAFRAAPISVTQPVTFLQLVWATLLGWAVFGEGVDGFVLLGGAIIVGSVVTISLREARKSAPRRARTPPLAP